MVTEGTGGSARLALLSRGQFLGRSLVSPPRALNGRESLAKIAGKLFREPHTSEGLQSAMAGLREENALFFGQNS